ncbi:hypothetical protein BLNAU_7643 [Blattamonas nauphoetae]|uniref:Uncharacterized protein n=1 Tax=Blattamonas nauphoetae TaxID=2049346 RepID=A0ABQ9Y169_9EUKA|nr:hypothetical protein BLNAU_7643 [Blattamonas nauphoetae]
MKEKVDRREKKFDKWKAQTAEQIDNMFTHQLIAIAEEEHAITKLLYSGLENADEEDPEKVSSEKKHKMEIRFGKTQNATQTNLVEFARQRKEYQKRGPKIESIEKTRKAWDEREDEEGVRRARRRGRRETSEKTRKAWDEREDEEGVRRARRRGRRGTSEKTRKA